MASKIYYYVNNDKRTVTAVIYGTIKDALNRLTIILKNTKNVNDFFYRDIIYSAIDKYNCGDTVFNEDNGMLYGKDDKISSTITAEPDVEFNEDTIARLKYIAKCSVKNKYHKQLENTLSKYFDFFVSVAGNINNNIYNSTKTRSEHQFSYVDVADWEKIKENRRKQSTDEI